MTILVTGATGPDVAAIWADVLGRPLRSYRDFAREIATWA